MSIRRFDTREWIEDGEARVEFEAVPSGTWVLNADHEAEVERLKADVSMLRREVFRESELRRNLEAMLKSHDEYLRENKMLDDQARAATDEAGALKGVQS